MILNRRALPVDVMLDPMTDRCEGGWPGGEKLTDVMMTWGMRYLSWRAWIAVLRDSMSMILTSERSLIHVSNLQKKTVTKK